MRFIVCASIGHWSSSCHNIEVEGVEEWEVKKILNKRKIREVEKYLV